MRPIHYLTDEAGTITEHLEEVCRCAGELCLCFREDSDDGMREMTCTHCLLEHPRRRRKVRYVCRAVMVEWWDLNEDTMLFTVRSRRITMQEAHSISHRTGCTPPRRVPDEQEVLLAHLEPAKEEKLPWNTR